MNEKKVKRAQPKTLDKREIHIKKKIFFFKKFPKYKEHTEKSIPKFLCKKTNNSIFQIENYNNKINVKLNRGRWSEEEHNKFLEGLVIYGPKWKKLGNLIKTRSLCQIRSHNQKFFLKMKLCKDKNLNIDFTLNSILSLGDMIKQIESNSNNSNIINVFKYLSKKREIHKKRKKKNINIKNEVMIEIKNENEIELEENNFLKDSLYNSKIKETNKMNIPETIREKNEIIDQKQYNQNNFMYNNNYMNNIFNNNIYNINNPFIYNYYHINTLYNLLINYSPNSQCGNNFISNYLSTINNQNNIINRISLLNSLSPSLLEQNNNITALDKNINLFNDFNSLNN